MTYELAVEEAKRQQKEHDDFRLVLLLLDRTYAVMTWPEYLHGLGKDLNPFQIAWDGTVSTDERNAQLHTAAQAYVENHERRTDA